MRADRVGRTLLSLAARVCDPETIDTVALPLVADMQFEVLGHAHRPALARAWIRTRGCAAFVEAIALSVWDGHGRTPMKSNAFGWVRLLLAIPGALLVTLGVQWATLRLFGGMIQHPGAHGYVEGVNLTKIVSSPFMSAALFWTLCLVAPTRLRRPAAIGALIVIGLWGGLMLLGSVVPRPNFHGWLLGLGLALWLGGGLSFWLALRLRVVSREPA
jgi:hypothetical protein